MKKIVILSTLFFINSVYAQNPILPNQIVGVYESSPTDTPKDIHVFLENGDYCYMARPEPDGYLFNFTGKWQALPVIDGSYRIKLKYETFFNTQYPAWIALDERVIKPQVIIQGNSFIHSDTFSILGFSDSENPKNLKMLYKSRLNQDDKNRSINIPKNARYVFIGVDRDSKGNFLITRYDLMETKKTLHPLYIGVDSNYAVIKFLDKPHSEIKFLNNELVVRTEDKRVYQKRTFNPVSRISDKNEQRFYQETCVNPIRNHDKQSAKTSLKYLPELSNKPVKILEPVTMILKENYSDKPWFKLPSLYPELD